jgi:hypothetical protein
MGKPAADESVGRTRARLRPDLMTHARTGKVQGLALALLAVAVLAAGGALLFLGPGAEPTGDPTTSVATDEPGLPDPGRLSRDPGPLDGGAQQPTRTESSVPEPARAEGPVGAGVLGKVVDESGRPIAGALVWISERWQFGAMPTAQPAVEDPLTKRITGADGVFVFERLPAGAEMNLWAFHADYAPRLAAPFSARDTVQELPPLVLEAGATIEGVTQDTGGNPLVARVELIYQDSGNFRGGTLAEQREQDLRLGRLKVVESDGQGRFSFRGVGSGSIWSLRAYAEGYATAEIMPVMVQPDQPTEPYLMVLGTEHVIAGVVINDERQPIAGAQITVSRTQPRPVFTAQGVSEADGTFTLRGLPEGVYGLAAVAEGYAYGKAQRVEVDAPPLEIMLGRKGGVAGRVTTPDGAPLAAYRLELMRTRRNTAQYGETGMTWDIADPEGNYRIEGLDAGTYVLLVRADGTCPTYSPGFQVGRDVVIGMDVQMSAGGRVIGVVRDAQGAPLAGAAVTLRGPQFQPPVGGGFFAMSNGDPDNVPVNVARSDATGRFTLEHATPGEMRLHVEHPTHLAELVPVSVREGATTETGEIRLLAGGTVFGTALDQHGKPLSGGTVSLSRQDGDNLFHSSLLLDTRGSFRFDGLRGGTYEIFAFPNVGDALWFPPEDGVQKIYVTEGKETKVELRAQTP